MKFATIGLLFVTVGAMQVVAAPTERSLHRMNALRRLARTNQQARQNDMVKCEKGERGPPAFTTFDNAHCDNQCTYEETSGDNEGLVCTGRCVQDVTVSTMDGISSPTPHYYCVGDFVD